MKDYNPKYPFKFCYFLLFLIIIPFSKNSLESVSGINCDSKSSAIEKLKSHDIVFRGTRHQQTAIISFISDLITALQNNNITHIVLETASDQQDNIDRFMKTGTGLSAIDAHSQNDFPDGPPFY